MTLRWFKIGWRLLALCSLGLGASACKQAEAPPFLDHVDVVFEQGRASLSLEFFADLKLQLNAFAALEPYGFIQFAASTVDRGFVINSDLHVDIFRDPKYQKTIVDSLPNGTPFPSYVGSPLAAHDFHWSPQWTGTLYLGQDPGKRLFGASVNLSFVDKQFPKGLNITQTIRDGRDAIIGAVTFFGPRVNDLGRVVHPGGVFVVVNLNDLVTYGTDRGSVTVQQRVPIVVEGPLEIHNPGGADVSPQALLRLYEQTFAAGRESGLLK